MRHVSLFTAAALALLASSGARAQPVAQPAHAMGDISGFQGGPDALLTALRAVEAGEGGRVIEIRFDRRDGAPGYDAVVAKGPRLEFVRMESAGGLTAVALQSRPVWMMDWTKRADVRVGERAKVSLAEAIRTAEKEDGGAPAVAAGVARSASNPDSDVHAYNVLLVSPDGHPRRVAIDSATDELISNPNALSGWP